MYVPSRPRTCGPRLCTVPAALLGLALCAALFGWAGPAFADDHDGDTSKPYDLPFRGSASGIDVEPPGGEGNRERREWCTCVSGGTSLQKFKKAVIEALLREPLGDDAAGILAAILTVSPMEPVQIKPVINLDYGGYLRLDDVGGVDIPNVDFPVQLNLAHPKPNSFSRNNTIRISPSWTPKAGASLTATPPLFETELGGFVRDLRLEIVVEWCVDSSLVDAINVALEAAGFGSLGSACLFSERLIIYNTGLNVDIPLLTVTEDSFDVPGVLGAAAKANLFRAGPSFLDFKDLNGDTFSNYGVFTIAQDTDSEGRPRLSFATTAPPCTFFVPEIGGTIIQPGRQDLDTFARVNGGKTLSRSGTTNDVISLGVDMVSFIDLALDAIPGATCIQTSYDIGVFSIDIGDIAPTYYINQTVDLDLTPTPHVKFDLGRVMHWKVYNAPAGSAAGSGALSHAGTGRFVPMFAADQVIDVRYPDTTAPSDVAPTFGVASDLQTQVTQQDQVAIALSLLQFRLPAFDVEEFSLVSETVGRADFSLPPPGRGCTTCEPVVYPVVLQNSTVPVGSVAAGDAFPHIPGPTFLLDPENPVVDIQQEVSAVRNNGGGTRTITYTYKISNQGDVPLWHTQIESDLATTFDKAVSWTVDEAISCDFALNPSFDGKADVNLLVDEVGVPDGGQGLAVGESGIVVVIVTVEPGPSPAVSAAPFLFPNQAVARARSRIAMPYIPNGTAVTAEDTDTVNLGPAQIDELGQFVLYAGEDLSIQRTEDSFGHVGANDRVHVKSGDAGTLAGDIHAPTELQVGGSLVADYVLVKKAKVVGKGALSPTGHLVAGLSLPLRTIPAVALPAATGKLTGLQVPDGGSHALVPGAYGSVELGKGATLRIGPGTYSLHGLTAAEGARIHVDPTSDPITVYVTEKLHLQKDVRMSIPVFPASTRDVHFLFAGKSTVHVGQGSHVLGNFVAPKASVQIMQGAHLIGSAYAHRISVAAGASYEYHDESCDGVLYLEFDSDCDGEPNCTDPTP